LGGCRLAGDARFGGIDEFVVRYAMGELYSTQSPRESGPWLTILKALGLHD